MKPSLTSNVQFQHKKIRRARNIEYHLDGLYIITMKSNSNSIALHLISDILNTTDDPPSPDLESRNLQRKNYFGNIITAELNKKD